MGWYLIDSNGYVGDLASITGLAEVRDACAGTPAALFFRDGKSDDPVALRREISKIRAESRTVQATLDNLSSLLEKAKGTVMISDGLEEYDSETEIEEES